MRRQSIRMAILLLAATLLWLASASGHWGYA